MDPKKKTLYEDISTSSGSEDSENKLFSSDDSLQDPNYELQNDNSSTSESDHTQEAGTSRNDTSTENIDDDDGEWYEHFADIPDFEFNEAISGVKINFDESLPTVKSCFDKLWDQNIMDMILTSMNNYATLLKNTNRPHKKYSRYSSIRSFTMSELNHFLAICILQGHIKFPTIRKMFSMDPLYYSPIFHHTLSGRRFEEMLRCFSCCYGREVDLADRLNKVSCLMNKLLSNFRNAFYPPEQLSLDESLLLFRGRLSFRQYIKGKSAKYGIKFYALCSFDGYVLNMQIYKGKTPSDGETSKLETLVFSLLEPYLEQGHHLFMDNYYNSVQLSKKLLKRKTHSTGTLRSNRRGTPKCLTTLKLNKGQHKWKRNGNIYVSKWRDKREVMCITTKYQPKLIKVNNRFGQEKIKPEEIARYNDYMSGIDRSDQMISYYSSPRKSIRWYKKVMFHLLDVAIWNAFYIAKKYNDKLTLLSFRETLVKELLEISLNINDGRKLVKSGTLHGGKRSKPEEIQEFKGEMHFPDNIPNPKNPGRSYHMRCKYCASNQKRKETKYLCKTCSSKPALCIKPCFELYHKALVQ